MTMLTNSNTTSKQARDECYRILITLLSNDNTNKQQHNKQASKGRMQSNIHYIIEKALSLPRSTILLSTTSKSSITSKSNDNANKKQHNKQASKQGTNAIEYSLAH
jgi:hypothetical protein